MIRLSSQYRIWWYRKYQCLVSVSHIAYIKQKKYHGSVCIKICRQLPMYEWANSFYYMLWKHATGVFRNNHLDLPEKMWFMQLNGLTASEMFLRTFNRPRTRDKTEVECVTNMCIYKYYNWYLFHQRRLYSYFTMFTFIWSLVSLDWIKMTLNPKFSKIMVEIDGSEHSMMNTLKQ